ncbi:MAG: hypothetical protein NTW54_08680 [Bacteroidetes bacterium]|nr:hypothetical protein [Bacteroidota bacterium]
MQTLKLSFSKQMQIIVSNDGIAELLNKVIDEIREQIKLESEFYIGDGLYYYGKTYVLGVYEEVIKTPSGQIVPFAPKEEASGSIREFIRVLKSPKSLFSKFDDLVK